MAPVVPLEPLRNAVLALGGAVLLLAIFLLLQRSLALLARTRAARREPALTRAIYDALQSSPADARRLPRLSRFDRKLVRSILLDLALDLRGETAEAIANLYRQLGFLRRDLRRMKSWRATTRANTAADLGLTTLLRHRGMIGRPRYGNVGMIALPGFLVFEMVSPLVEMSGYLLLPLLWWFGLLSPTVAGTFFVLAVMYMVLVSALAVLLEDLAFRRYASLGDLARLLVAAVLENFGFRQLTVWWRIQAFWQYLRGDLSWGAMERRGVAARTA